MNLQPRATPRTVIVLIHALGGSARAWSEVETRLADRFDTLPIALPGFGEAARLGARDVAGMVAHVAGAIRAASPARYVMVGHSMGAKIACAVARAAEDGAEGLAGLARLVLVAGSPPAPEPMDEARRAEMRAWFAGDAAQSRDEAARFVRANVAGKLADHLERAAIEDVLAADRDAWRAWLDHGSREDWTGRIGVLATPSVIVSGAEDQDLGAETQARAMEPHFADLRHVTLPGAHLLPLESPAALATVIAADEETPVPADFAALIASGRVSRRTREVLRARAEPPGAGCLTPRRRLVLRAVLARVLPQPEGVVVDLAARIDAALAQGASDGWRFAALPPDRTAMEAALETLDRAGFVASDASGRDALLQRVEAGELAGAGLDPAALKLWFEDLRAEAARHWVAHPAVMARLGYGGFACGGDGPEKSGFTEIGLGRREAWEPAA